MYTAEYIGHVPLFNPANFPSLSPLYRPPRPLHPPGRKRGIHLREFALVYIAKEGGPAGANLGRGPLSAGTSFVYAARKRIEGVGGAGAGGTKRGSDCAHAKKGVEALIKQAPGFVRAFNRYFPSSFG